MRKRYYKRWTDIGSDWKDAMKIAQKHMTLTWGGKPGLVAFYGYYLHGTPEQMKQVEKDWTSANIDWYSRKPKGAWNIPEKKVNP